jgi:hypothetical protein
MQTRPPICPVTVFKQSKPEALVKLGGSVRDAVEVEGEPVTAEGRASPQAPMSHGITVWAGGPSITVEVLQVPETRPDLNAASLAAQFNPVPA